MIQYKNINRTRELSILICALATNIERLMNYIPKEVIGRARTIVTYSDSILLALMSSVPEDRRKSMRRNVANYICEIKPKTATTVVGDGKDKVWYLTRDQIDALISINPDECYYCDKFSKEEQKDCKLKAVLQSMDIDIYCDNSLDD